MRRGVRIVALELVLCTLLAGAVIPGWSQTSPLITLDADLTAARATEVKNVKAGQVIPVELYGEDISGANGYRVTLAYDSAQLRFVDFTITGTIPGLSGLIIKDDSKGAVQLGGASVGATATVAKGALGVANFEVLSGFSGSVTITAQAASILTLAGPKSSTATSVVTVTGTVAPLSPRAGDGTGTLDLNVDAGDQNVRTLGGVKPGQQVNVQVIMVKESPNAAGFQVIVTFDPKKLKVVSGKGEGVFLTAIFPGPPQVKDNTATYAGSFLGQTVTAKGPVAVLTFEALGGFTGETEIVLSSLAARVSGVFNTVTPGASVVLSSGGAGLASDFDGTGTVDFDDFFAFAGAFGQKGTGANAKFDLDKDGDIGFGDFFIFAGDFGKTTKAGKTAVYRLDEAGISAVRRMLLVK